MQRLGAGFGRKTVGGATGGYYRADSNGGSFGDGEIPFDAEHERDPDMDDDIDYRIIGNDLQFVEIELDPGESVVAEPGAMIWKDFDIDVSTTLGDGTDKDADIIRKLIGAGTRAFNGESLFTVTYTNNGIGLSRKARVAFSAPVPGNIVPLRLEDYDSRIICQKESFLAAARGVSTSIKMIPGFFHMGGERQLSGGLTGMFGGEGFLMQTLEGKGWAFVHMGGTVIERQLAAGERLHVDTGCVAAYTESVDYTLVSAGSGFKNKLFGGEGWFYASLTGPGTVWIQSMPFARLAAEVHAATSATQVATELGGGIAKAAGTAAVGAVAAAGAASLGSEGLLGTIGGLLGDR
jgi:uncharacterized protein (AIM24 family)